MKKPALRGLGVSIASCKHGSVIISKRPPSNERSNLTFSSTLPLNSLRRQFNSHWKYPVRISRSSFTAYCVAKGWGAVSVSTSISVGVANLDSSKVRLEFDVLDEMKVVRVELAWKAQ